jgi:RNA polymerase sigma-70 factor (ECF subfamily)
MHTTSVALLDRLRQPADPEAWSRFVELYTPLLYRWACRLGLQDADALDLVQDVLGVLLVKMPAFQYDPGKSFRAWLHTVLLNHWRDRRRQSLAPLPDDVPVPDPAEAVWEAEYRTYLVGRALRLMRADFEPTTWQACWETAAMGRPPAEVAAELGMTLTAVYIARSRVLRRLREELAGLFEE